jgi:predicted metal-dependent HD superfamily phosphohydrolase
MDFQELLTRWHVTLSKDDILQCWSEPHRAYHGITHLVDLLEQIEGHVSLPQKERDMLTLVAIFHDIIYNPRRTDNEARSAELFLQCISMDKDSPDIQEIATIIRDTKTHKPSTPLSVIFCHMDTDVVRRPYPELLQWEDGIRREYSHLPGIAYVVGRVRFLEKMRCKFPENAAALRMLQKKLLFPWKK